FDLTKAGVRVGSPGAARLVTAAETAAEAAAAKAKAEAAARAADTSVSMPQVGQIYISEIMVAGGGTLPQWIEISNGSRTEQVNLSGWTITIDNAAADADVSVGASIELTIPEGTKIDPSGQNDTPSTVLVVTEAGRNNVDGSGQVLNIWTA
ncbi:lamin tail domain-containing protein, partial [Candidatus Poribacteria bacterium]|nr:lamin tail domain-containing protein [Candidatus Poribacteria bacterium]